MPYSVHIPTHIDLFSMSITPSDLICTRVTFIAYFVFLVLIGELIGEHDIYLMGTRARTIGELFCTYISSCWPILYVIYFLLPWSVQLPPHVDVFSELTTCSWPILFIGKFLEAYTLNILPCFWLFSTSTNFSWSSLYTYILLVTYFVYKVRFNCLFCTYTFTSLPLFYKYNLFIT